MMEKIDLSKELQEFYEQNKHEKCIRNWEETLKTTKGFLGVNFLKDNVGGDDVSVKTGRVFTSIHNEEDFIFSLGRNDVFYYKKFLLFKKVVSWTKSPHQYDYYKVNYSNIGNLNIEYKKSLNLTISYYKLNDFVGSDIVSEIENQLFKEIHTLLEKPLIELKKLEEEQERLEQERLEQKRLKELNQQRITDTKLIKE